MLVLDKVLKVILTRKHGSGKRNLSGYRHFEIFLLLERTMRKLGFFHNA
jgi:hypothetical protein